MASSLKKNVEQLIKSRGLSRAQLSARVGMDDAHFVAFLQDPPKQSEAVLKKISHELLVPDFMLFAEDAPVRTQGIPDFRLTHPARAGYSRPTLKWMDFATAIQEYAGQVAAPNKSLSLRAIVSPKTDIATTADRFRKALKITDADQIATANCRLFYSEVRKRVEEWNVFVLQLSFPDTDGAGFCLTGDAYDVIVLNTKRQNHARRLFTLAHEIYHCALGETGVSDPDVVQNNVERKCNQFAAYFIAPDNLVRTVAADTITSRSLIISDLKKFSNKSKLSMHASVLRLVELGFYNGNAIGAWNKFIATQGNFDAQTGGGGKRVEEWKYKLARYGFQFARVFGSESGRDILDPLEMFHFSGIRPKYQRDYFKRGTVARAEDAEEDEEGGADE
jgi:Zn-dependent peptidase ImmA (M78 family)